MRAISLILVVFIMSSMLYAQAPTRILTENIVPNPGFEKYSSTPIGWFYKGKHFTNVMKYWNSATAASPDVFGPKVRVPSHWASKGFGEQSVRTGASMVGITVYGCENGKPHCREYVQIQLKEPLVVGQNYYAEFWVNSLERSLRSNNLAMYFSKDPINIKTDQTLEVKPQIIEEDIIDANGKRWVKVYGHFKAKKEAAYLTIGNFIPDSLTQTKMVHPNSLNYAYFYIDDVLVKKEDPIINVPVKEDDLSRITIEEGKIVPLKNIFFESDKSGLLPRSHVELKKLLRLLYDNPTMIIDVCGHTDNIGEFDYNQDLSRRRAQEVVEYLNKNGISPDRTLYNGFGSTRPVASNYTDDGRQLNRRVEFLIVQK